MATASCPIVDIIVICSQLYATTYEQYHGGDGSDDEVSKSAPLIGPPPFRRRASELVGMTKQSRSLETKATTRFSKASCRAAWKDFIKPLN